MESDIKSDKPGRGNFTKSSREHIVPAKGLSPSLIPSWEEGVAFQFPLGQPVPSPIDYPGGRRTSKRENFSAETHAIEARGRRKRARKEIGLCEKSYPIPKPKER